ncbi:MAG: hypothetical protein JST40_04800 [Armatimonadetes bacterium]|nr:hypothetical protein [Armatimonadota bacterium]
MNDLSLEIIERFSQPPAIAQEVIDLYNRGYIDDELGLGERIAIPFDIRTYDFFVHPVWSRPEIAFRSISASLYSIATGLEVGQYEANLSNPSLEAALAYLGNHVKDPPYPALFAGESAEYREAYEYLLSPSYLGKLYSFMCDEQVEICSKVLFECLHSGSEQFRLSAKLFYDSFWTKFEAGEVRDFSPWELSDEDIWPGPKNRQSR